MKIGIIGAMNEEIERMKTEMEIVETHIFATVTFYEGKMNGQDLILCKCGVGKVNAALTSQILIDKFTISHLLFTGVAGAVDDSLDVGDLVISTSAMQHDLDVTPLGFKKGEIPYFNGSSDFQADETLIQMAVQAAKALPDRRIVQGRIVSGDQFIADHKYVQSLREEFTAACVEMEGAAVAQVAAMNDVPFVIIRSMSDKANGEASVNFQEFTVLASEQSHLLVSNIVRTLKGTL
ncbi:5'-methylthioadenosine/adenosylhomocysteine nucleosidase [Alkalihalobacillus sp. MEB130]|uniref:5'-methylthioadenosine/adenosylhomocysteine nucleosidase n=1 Tax=Alkalihalobacillus sp. MEB130 TaxID=2976704 RepID=UPI0028DEC024|nr:5'-methylthioadenosine/adenosylhomocysteine nucleosidase [Alkalihalobacillus sp. MEB130]MDT8859367.1 5'-methylthioadenosine/adenosylhomocysteine nucleosidase [Alkalihalobacillus sp. MEB130]